MFKRTLRIGTRRSPLALKQVEEVLGRLQKFYPEINTEIIGIDTYADNERTTPISDIEGTDFFTREIDEAVLKGEIDPSTSLRVNGERSRTIDFAVHSAKDLAAVVPLGLIVVAITKSIDPDDALVSKGNLRLNQLSKGAKIGVSSQRRKEQLKKYRDDFQAVDIRGNIQERMRRLDSDGLDAIIVAACALTRLGLQNRIAQRLPHCIFRPHPLQGALAIVTREDHKDLINLLRVLNPAPSLYLNNVLNKGAGDAILKSR